MGNIDRQKETLSEYLERIMRECRISRVILAKGSGIALSTLYTYLRGQKPNLDNCRKIAVYLNVPLVKIISMVRLDIEEARLSSMLELYIDLPEEQRQLAENMMMTIHRQFGKHKHIGTRQEIDG